MPQLHNHCIHYRFHRLYSHISITMHHHSRQHSQVHYIQQQIHTLNHLWHQHCLHMVVANIGDRLHHHNNNNKYALSNNFSFHFLFVKNLLLLSGFYFIAIAISIVSSISICISASMASIGITVSLFSTEIAVT